jgi:hypothetical protein
MVKERLAHNSLISFYYANVAHSQRALGDCAVATWPDIRSINVNHAKTSYIEAVIKIITALNCDRGKRNTHKSSRSSRALCCPIGIARFVSEIVCSLETR